MAKPYTGEVVTETPSPQEGAGARPYTGEVIPLAAPAAPSGAPPVKPPPDLSAGGGSNMDFTSGNLAYGIANMLGAPVDTVRNALNLGIAGYGYAKGGGEAFRTKEGKPYSPPELIPEKSASFPAGYGGSETWRQLFETLGLVNPRATQPESTSGRYAAAALQMAPGAAIGRPSAQQLPRALSATTTSGVASEAAADIGGEEWRGVGAMLPGARSMQRKPAGERATEARQAERFAKAKEMGIPIPPREMKPDKPQQRIADTINKELGQPVGAPIDPKTLQAYRNAHWGDYEAVIKSPALAKGVQPSAAFQAEIQAIGSEIEAARANLPQTFKGMRPVLTLLGEYGYGALPPGAKATIPPRQQPIPADVTVRAIKKLRADATANISAHDKPEKIELGMTQRRVANALEKLIEENLARTGDQALMGSFRQARTAIAKSHDVEASLDPVTRKVSAARLSKLMTEGRPLSGGLRDVAEVGGEFPSVTAKPKSEGYFTHRVTPMAVLHPEAMSAHWLTRLADPITMSTPYQRMLVDPLSRLTLEQQQALRYLSAATASNREIPPPPQ